MRPNEWDALVAAGHLPRSVLADEAKTILGRLTGEPISTVDLSKMIYTGGNKQIMSLLQNMATHELACYARRLPPRVVRRFVGGKWISRKERPWAWSNYGTPNDENKSLHTCPKCGTVF